MLPLVLMTMGMTMQSCGDDDDDDIVNVSAKFDNALKALYPDATGVKWETKRAYHVAEFTKGFTSYDVWFDSNAVNVMTEMDYGKDLFLVPDNAVSGAFPTSEYGTWTIDEITHYVRPADEFYIFEVSKPGREDMDLYYSTDGTLLKAIAESQSPDIYPDTKI